MQNPQPPVPILVTLTPSQIDIALGSPPADLAISVRNNGQSVDQYGIEVEGLDPAWYSLDVQSFSLFPGDTFDGKLAVRVPGGARPVAGAYPFTVHVGSRTNPQTSGAARALARVGEGRATRGAAGRHSRSMWLPLLLAALAVVAMAVIAYFVLGNSTLFKGGISSSSSSSPSATAVAQIILSPALSTATLPPAASPTRIPSPVPTQPGGGPCPVFPADNIWNRNISALPTSVLSDAYINSIGASAHVHADFGSGLLDGGPIGIPFVTVPGSQPFVPINFTEYGDQSDPGPYPLPTNAPIEGGPSSGGDRHVLVIDSGNCTLYEMYHGYPQRDGSWNAGSGAVFNLNSNALRPANWTSTDAAGLPIYPGLVTYDEVASGAIHHAIRFTVPETQQAFIWPARHQAGDTTDPNYPPMGLRVRLKASVDISGYDPQIRVILQAMKDYGMFVADNGSPWYISGAPDERWDNDLLHTMDALQGSDFEAIDESSLMIDPNSGQIR